VKLQKNRTHEISANGIWSSLANVRVFSAHQEIMANKKSRSVIQNFTVRVNPKPTLNPKVSLFKEYFNLSVKETLSTWTVMETSIGISGLIGVLFLNQFI
jgi:hypothetical protein